MGGHDRDHKPADDPWAKIKAFEGEIWQGTQRLQTTDAARFTDPSAMARLGKRFEIAGGDVQELEQDMRALVREGHADPAHVDALIARKRAELAVELKHTVKLTDDHGAHWSQRELGVVDAELDRIPADHLIGLNEINRTPVIKDARGEPRRDPDARNVPAATNYDARLVAMYDSGFTDGGRLSGVESELSGRRNPVGEAETRARAGLGFVDEDLGHELGHWAHVKNASAKAKFDEASGWNAGKPMFPGDPSWSYAQTHADEHFAEVYTNAINTPEKLYQDMIQGPQAAQAAAMNRWIAAQRGLIGAQALGDHDALAAAAKKLQAEQTAMSDANHAADSLGAQWRIMREDVFGVTDADVAASTMRVMMSGADKTKLAEFRRKAGMAMTRDQLDRLTDRYGG